MLAVAMAMIAAIAIAPGPEFAAMIVAVGSILLCICLLKRFKTASLLLAGVLLGTVSYRLNVPPQVPRALFDCEGVYRGRVERASYGAGTARCVVRLSGFEKTTRCALTVYNADYQLIPGDEIAFRALLQPAGVQRLPFYGTGGSSFKAAGIVVRATVNFDNVEMLRESCSLEGKLAEAGLWISQIIHSTGLSRANADILAGMLLGESTTDGDTLSQFRKSGMAHLLCVSGFHVALFAWLVSLLLFPLGRSSGLRIVKFSLMILAVWTYAAMTGLWPSAVRAALMLSIFLVSKMLSWRVRPLNILSLAVVIMLCYNANQLWSISFQLSVSAVAALCVFGKSASMFGTPGSVAWYAGSFVVAAAAASLGTAPVMLAHFHSISLLSVPVNFFSALLAPVFICCGILLTVLTACGCTWPAMTKLCGLLGDGLTGLAGQGAGGFKDGFYFSTTGIVLIIIAICSMAAVLYSRRASWRWAAFITAIICFASAGHFTSRLEWGTYANGNEIVEIHPTRISIRPFGPVAGVRSRYRNLADACGISADSMLLDVSEIENSPYGSDIVIVPAHDRTPASEYTRASREVILLQKQPPGRRAEFEQAFGNHPELLHDCLYNYFKISGTPDQ